MPPVAVLLIVASTLLHLAWNSLARSVAGNLRFMWLLTLGGGLLGLALSNGALLNSAFWAAWPWIVATILLHAAYFSALGAAYARAELSWAYPVARGVAIALTPPLALVVFGQRLAGMQWAGLALVLAGLASMQVPAAPGEKRVRPDTWAVVWTLLVGLLVTGYSLVDSQGVRYAAALPYVALGFFGSAALMTPLGLRAKPVRRVRGLHWATALFSGAASLISYLFMLLAYQIVAVGPALALRQVASALAPAAGWLFLREHPGPWRTLGAVSITAGAVLLVLAP